MKISRRKALKTATVALLAGPAALKVAESPAARILLKGELTHDVTPQGPWVLNMTTMYYELRSPRGQVLRRLSLAEAVERRLWLVNGHLVRARFCAKTY